MEPTSSSVNSSSPLTSLQQWSQWQLLDSLLPTGGFAHSYGLEAAVQTRLVSTSEDLEPFIIQILDNTGSLLLPFVYSTCKNPTLANFTNLNNLLDAILTNEVGRKASITQGSALLRVAAEVFVEAPAIKAIRAAAATASFGSSVHHALAFGIVCGILGFDSCMTQRAYMFLAMRDVISAATRLNLVGPISAAVIQHRIAPDAEKIVERWKDRPVEDAGQTAPLLDTIQGCHAYLFSRLFSS